MIHFLNFFTILHRNTPADTAKKRLKIIISQDQSNNINIPIYLPQLRQDLIKVIRKYTKINSKTLSFQFGKKDDNTSILELNVTLNEIKKKKTDI